MRGTGKAGENGQSSVWVAKLMLEQTVGCNTREGGCYWVNWYSTAIAIDWVTGRSSHKIEKAQCTVRPT